MTIWEYKVTTLFGEVAKDDREALNSIGKDGWERACVTQLPKEESLLRAYFKRKKIKQ